MPKKSTRILVVTSVHPPHDARIVRQLLTLAGAGYECTLLAPWAGTEREYPFLCRFFQRKSGLLGRLLAQFMFLRLTLLQKWDAIHFHDFDLALAATLVRLLTWQRVIYDVHENYAEEVMVRSYIPDVIRVPLKHFVNVVEWVAVRVIGRVVVVVPVQVERFERWGCRRIALVRNFALSSFAPQEPVNHFAHTDHQFVINTGGQAVNTGALLLLNAASSLQREGRNIPIRGIDRFEGTPGLRDYILEQKEKDAINYQLLPRVLPHELERYLRLSAIGLSLRLDTPSQRMGIPTKIFEYMAYGIPIIATDIGYQAQIIRETGAGILVPHDDPNALASAIAELWDDSNKRAQLGRNGRKAFFSFYCWENEAKQLVDFYRAL